MLHYRMVTIRKTNEIKPERIRRDGLANIRLNRRREKKADAPKGVERGETYLFSVQYWRTMLVVSTGRGMYPSFWAALSPLRNE